MRARRLLVLGLLASIAQAPLSAPGWGQSVRTRILQGIEVRRGNRTWEIRISFTIPVRYVRHSPRERGDSLIVQITPLRVGASERADLERRESLAVPRDNLSMLEEVTYEGDTSRSPELRLHFMKPVRFSVRQGGDVRSIVISVIDSGVPSQATKSAATRTELLMEEGRKAMTEADYGRAILLYTKALSIPENRHSRQALEYLALAYERNGQRAHARAEYESYLRRYPEGPDSERVRQRLQALITIRARPRVERAPRTAREAREIDFDVFGSLYTSYRKASSFLDELGETETDSTLLTDMYVGSRLRTERLTVRTEMSGGYLYDFLDSDPDNRLSSLYVDLRDAPSGLSSSVGRRSQSRGGVLGRFDGARLGWRFADDWEVGVVGGIPVDSSSVGSIDLDRQFGGVSLDFSGLGEKLDVEVFGIHQWNNGLLDRAAVGAEVRFFQDGLFGAAFVDYDVYFQSLNIAQLTGNWQVTDRTFVNFLADYRNVPLLTLETALQGQGVDSLDDLRDSFGDDEIADLAEDRTARAMTFSLGGSHDFTDHVQGSLDFAATRFTGTSSSGGVEGLEGTGFEFFPFAQVVLSSLATEGDAYLLGVGVRAGEDVGAVTATLDARYPITRDLRVNPRIRGEYRFLGDERFALRPSLRFDYRIWRLNFEAEGGGEWRTAEPMADETGYFVTTGVRYDF